MCYILIMVLDTDYIPILQFMTHYGLHFIFPVLAAFLFYRKDWKKVSIILLCTMVIDLDHLLADPIFEANRMSVGFHFLHSYYAITLYTILLVPRKTRVMAIGLLLHILTDFQDFYWQFI